MSLPLSGIRHNAMHDRILHTIRRPLASTLVTVTQVNPLLHLLQAPLLNADAGGRLAVLVPLHAIRSRVPAHIRSHNRAQHSGKRGTQETLWKQDMCASYLAIAVLKMMQVTCPSGQRPSGNERTRVVVNIIILALHAGMINTTEN